MRKLGLLFTFIYCLTVLAACSSGANEEPTAAPTEERPTMSPTTTTEAQGTELPTRQPTAYPAPATPTPPGSDGGYPGFTPIPTSDPYPGGLATIMHPMGLQCEEAIFPDLSAAIGSLEEAGITVAAAEEIGLEVCEACGCATSQHYRVQISVDDLAKALDMGWQR